MITKNEIAKIAKQILKRQRGLRDHQIIHPTREWFVGLAFSLLILIGGAMWSIFTYLEVSGRTVETTSTEVVTANVYRGDIVNAALVKFRERTDNFNQLLENRIEFTLPAEPGESEPETEPDLGENESNIETASSTQDAPTSETTDVLTEEDGGIVAPDAMETPAEPATDPGVINFN